MTLRKLKIPPLVTPVDALLLVMAAAVSLGSYGFRLWGTESGAGAGRVAVVQAGSREVARLRLSRDTTITVQGELGKVDVVVRDGEVSFEHAPCPQGICEKTGPVGSPGWMIVCAPNKVLARVEAGPAERQGGPDAISR